MDACVDNLSQYEKLVVNQTLPDLTCLLAYLLYRIVPQNKHA